MRVLDLGLGLEAVCCCGGWMGEVVVVGLKGVCCVGGRRGVEVMVEGMRRMRRPGNRGRRCSGGIVVGGGG